MSTWTVEYLFTERCGVWIWGFAAQNCQDQAFRRPSKRSFFCVVFPISISKIQIHRWDEFVVLILVISVHIQGTAGQTTNKHRNLSDALKLRISLAINTSAHPLFVIFLVCICIFWFMACLIIAKFAKCSFTDVSCTPAEVSEIDSLTSPCRKVKFILPILPLPARW